MSPNRRIGLRVPVRLLINQYAADWHHQSISFDLSPDGMYVYHHRLPEWQVVSLEFQLPGMKESVWAKGEVRFFGRFGEFQGAGIAFTAMANKHWDMIHDWVIQQRLSQLKQRLGLKTTDAALPLAA